MAKSTKSEDITSQKQHAKNHELFPFPEWIPEYVGAGIHRKRMQRRSLTMWLTLAASAIAFSNAKTSEIIGIHLSPKLRAAVLSFAFPGAGYIACANLVGGGLFLLTWLLMPVALFAWFGAGAVSMPLGLWVLSVAGAYLAASSTGIFNWAGLIAGALVASAVIYFNRLSARERIAANKKRDVRNEYLPQELATMAVTATSNTTHEDRELSLEELRRFQFILEVGSQPIDDFSNYTVIDQFQTSAIRYQMYELMYVLGMYQVIFAPNFHGYCTQIYRQLIEKSLTQRVMGFWKWETLFGKFSTNYEPVYEDNIMVSGWLLQALALYTGNTGDMRYTKPGSLRFQIDKTHVYEHDIHSLSKSVVDQWERNPYTLFPCEPNWIYSICNMQGWLGQVVYDRVFGSTHTKRLGQRYETSLLTEFGEPDGSIVPIRSELTGFSIPGLCGALSDLCNAIFCRGHMDHIARRIWAIFRHENVRIDQETGELNLIGMVGADKIDPGTYKPSPYSMYPLVALTAGEFGDEEIRLKALAKLQKAQETNVENTGSLHQSQEHAGFSMNTSIMKAHMLRQGDWKRVVSKGIPPAAMKGPILDSVPYPDVLVAKARSVTSQDLNLVLYPSGKGGTFKIGITRLQPGQSYVINGKKDTAFTADGNGDAYIDILVDGRTAIDIRPKSVRTAVIG